MKSSRMLHEPHPVTRVWRSLRWMGKALDVALGISGLRLDRWRNPALFLPWLVCWLGSWSLFYAAFDREIFFESERTLQRASLLYTAVVWFLYYGLFLSVTLGSPLRGLLLRRFGETRAYAAYEALLGVVFLNQGLSQMAVMKAYDVGMRAFPTWSLLTAGAVLVAFGFFWKAWATWLTGLDTYYYRDMFLGRITATTTAKPFVVSGPFRFVENPMYGVGNLQAYGGALWYGSWPGLAVAGLFQASIYLFYFIFERPFVIKTYHRIPVDLPSSLG